MDVNFPQAGKTFTIGPRRKIMAENTFEKCPQMKF